MIHEDLKIKYTASFLALAISLSGFLFSLPVSEGVCRKDVGLWEGRDGAPGGGG